MRSSHRLDLVGAPGPHPSTPRLTVPRIARPDHPIRPSKSSPSRPRKSIKRQGGDAAATRFEPPDRGTAARPGDEAADAEAILADGCPFARIRLASLVRGGVDR